MNKLRIIFFHQSTCWFYPVSSTTNLKPALAIKNAKTEYDKIALNGTTSYHSKCSIVITKNSAYSIGVKVWM